MQSKVRIVLLFVGLVGGFIGGIIFNIVANIPRAEAQNEVKQNVLKINKLELYDEMGNLKAVLDVQQGGFARLAFLGNTDDPVMLLDGNVPKFVMWNENKQIVLDLPNSIKSKKNNISRSNECNKWKIKLNSTMKSSKEDDIENVAAVDEKILNKKTDEALLRIKSLRKNIKLAKNATTVSRALSRLRAAKSAAKFILGIFDKYPEVIGRCGYQSADSMSSLLEKIYIAIDEMRTKKRDKISNFKGDNYSCIRVLRVP